MLAQAVHSEDQKLMEEVLRVSKEKVVMASVRRLPVPCVIPFLKHVSSDQYYNGDYQNL